MKLEIELIPKTTFFTNVRSLVRKNEWDSIRKKCYSIAGNKCEICGGKGERWPVECHEIWQYNFATNMQSLKGLIALCPACHEVKHIGLARINGRFDEAVEHFMRVNQIPKIVALKEIKKAFNEWEKKNEVRWKLDTTFLKSYANPRPNQTSLSNGENYESTKE
jgi:hypothetical protein